jgi:hypothetical protein
MSFLRHAEIYRSDGREKAEEAGASSAHRLDEFPAGYSWAGCSPAEPACASPTSFSVSGPVHQANEFTANGIVSLIRLSQDRGPGQSRQSPSAARARADKASHAVFTQTRKAGAFVQT